MSKGLTIVITDELYQEMEQTAKEKGSSKGQVVREALINYFKQLELEKSIKNGQLPQFINDLKLLMEEQKAKNE